MLALIAAAASLDDLGETAELWFAPTHRPSSWNLVNDRNAQLASYFHCDPNGRSG